jgi:hypothetical protein
MTVMKCDAWKLGRVKGKRGDWSWGDLKSDLTVEIIGNGNSH